MKFKLNQEVLVRTVDGEPLIGVILEVLEGDSYIVAVGYNAAFKFKGSELQPSAVYNPLKGSFSH